MSIWRSNIDVTVTCMTGLMFTDVKIICNMAAVIDFTGKCAERMSRTVNEM